MKRPLAVLILFLCGCSTSERPEPAVGSVAAEAAVCGGNEFRLDHAESGYAPYVTLTLAGRSGPFLIDYGASDSVVEQGIWAIDDDHPNWRDSPAGRKFPLGPFNLPGWDASGGKVDFLVESRDIYLRPGVEQIGVLGADLFPNQIVHFSYEGDDRVYISPYPAPECPESVLRAAGFTRLDQSAHWAEGTQAPDGIHNGPVLYGHFLQGDGREVTGSFLWGQLDTGYDDIAFPRSLIVNDALFDALSRAGLTMRSVGTVTTKTCAGPAQAEVLAVSEPLAITTETGTAIGSVTGIHLIRSRRTRCGGISGSTAPAGQFGASFLEAIGDVVVHGPRKEVWLKF